VGAIPPLDAQCIDGDVGDFLVDEAGGQWVRAPDDVIEEEGYGEYGLGAARESVQVHWVTKVTRLTVVNSPYLAYGNESSISFTYGSVLLVVDINHSAGRDAATMAE